MIEQVVGLLSESRRRGFLGPGPVEHHLDHARAFAVAAQGAPRRALDLGAGGGLPGLVLAALEWPDARWVFLDSQLRRTTFLEEAVEELDLGERVEVVTARAEDFGRDVPNRAAFDLVVARSFGPPALVVECAAPLLEVGGAIVVSEPPAADLAARWPTAGLAVLGAGPATGVLVEDAGDPVHLVRVEQVEPCDERYPRRVGIPTKRPLFG